MPRRNNKKRKKDDKIKTKKRDISVSWESWLLRSIKRAKANNL